MPLGTSGLTTAFFSTLLTPAVGAADGAAAEHPIQHAANVAAPAARRKSRAVVRRTRAMLVSSIGRGIGLGLCCVAGLPGCAGRSAVRDGDVGPPHGSVAARASDVDAGGVEDAATALRPAEEGAWPSMGAAVEPRCQAGSGAPVTRTVEVAIGSPKPGRYESDGYVVMTEDCVVDARRRPGCRPFVVLSDLRSAGLKEPLSPAQDLVVLVDAPAATPHFAHVRVTYDLCPVSRDRAVGWAVTVKPLP